MSIRDEINGRVKEGRLFCLLPAIGNVQVVRHIFATEDVVSLVIGPWENQGIEFRAGQLRQYLDQFIGGDIVTMAGEPYKKPNSTYLSPLHPVKDRIWEIRNRDKPSIRVSGAFAEQDVFIALAWEYRADLGGKKSREWRDFREYSKARWRQLFHSYEPMSGDNRNELATNIIPV